MGPDEHLLALVAAHRSGAATWFALAVMAAGTSTAFVAAGAVVALVAVVVLRAYRPAVAAGLAVVAATVAAAALKQLVGRARPPADLALVHLGGASMPSTHAARTAAVAAAVWAAVAWSSARARRVGTVVLGCGVAVVGACLVYLGVHWATDVLAGWALGLPLGLLAGVAVRPGLLPGRLCGQRTRPGTPRA